jgi:hypothetical protein
MTTLAHRTAAPDPKPFFFAPLRLSARNPFPPAKPEACTPESPKEVRP